MYTHAGEVITAKKSANGIVINSVVNNKLNGQIPKLKMAGYSEPDWISNQQQSNTVTTVVADANLDPNVAAGLSPSAGG